MLFKRIKPWTGNVNNNIHNTTINHASSIVADMSEQIVVKDIQIKCLNEQISELKNFKEVVENVDGESEESNPGIVNSRRSSSSNVLDNVSLTITNSDFDDFQNSNITKDQNQLYKTYEETNSKLLEKLKIQESKNVLLLNKIQQMSNRIEQLENQLINNDSGSNYKDKLLGKTSLSSLTTAVDQEDTAESFINGLFDAIDLSNNNALDTDAEMEKKLSKKSSNNSLNSTNSIITSISALQEEDSRPNSSSSASFSLSYSNNNIRNSCSSLLSLNKSAIKSIDEEQPIAFKAIPFKARSPSTRSIKKRVHQLSLYLSPSSKDNLSIAAPHTPLSKNVSSPMSLRSFSDDLDDMSPITPQSPTFPSELKFSNSNNSKKLNFNNNGSNHELLKIPTMVINNNVSNKKGLKGESSRNFSPISMEIIQED